MVYYGFGTYVDMKVKDKEDDVGGNEGDCDIDGVSEHHWGCGADDYVSKGAATNGGDYSKDANAKIVHPFMDSN